MPFTLHPETIQLQHQSLEILVPDEAEIKKLYGQGEIAFPYWSKIWPSAYALTWYLEQHPLLYEGKNVLELAAGVGLPSLFVAQLAAQVTCSDKAPEAIEVAAASAVRLGYSNVDCRVLDWNNLSDDLQPDLLLLSDTNYAPEDFPALEKMILHFLNIGTMILLSTPPRLMAKEFINSIRPYVREEEEVGEIRVYTIYDLERERR
jgi:predicted nicotinamide N-methyase